jgi:hypothetical protein
MQRRTLSVLVASALALVACGGGKSAAPSTTTTTVAASSTSTTTGTSSSSSNGGTTTTGPTTTSPGAGVDPLTGLADQDPAILNRPALVVKINNHPYAWPQTGLNQADIVFEELVEGISRFAAVFHSQDSTPVGSIRSARTSDINILALLGTPLLAWSGGNDYVVTAIRRAKIVDVGFSFHSVEGGYFRTTDKQAPHNLYADTKKLFALARPNQGPPTAVFSFRGPTDALPSTAKDVAGVKLNFEATQVQYVWDATTQAWDRSEAVPGYTALGPQVDNAGVQVAPQNIVVLFCKYATSPADTHSPEAQTTGSGTAWVFTGGKVIEGTWSRPKATDPLTLKDSAGTPIALTPGKTWVELPRQGTTPHAVQIPLGTSPDMVSFPKG